MSEKVKLLKIVLLVVLSLTLASVAYAIPTTIQFTACDFASAEGAMAAPTDPITGTIVFDAVGESWENASPIISIDMTIAGHQYQASEVSISATDFGLFKVYYIGGNAGGIDVAVWGTTDFFFVFGEKGENEPDMFYYTVSDIRDLWITNKFSEYSVKEGTAVPEPATMLLLGLGLLGLVGVRRKIQK